MFRFHRKEQLMPCRFREDPREARRRRYPFLLPACCGILLVLAFAGVIAPTRASAITLHGSGAAGGSTFNLRPPSFERNEGQAPEDVGFFSRGADVDLFLTWDEVVLASEAGVLRMRFVGAKRNSRAVGLNELGHRSNYFIGRDPAGWRTGVRHFERVEYSNLYRGIDMSARVCEDPGWEMVFVVSPEGSPRAIRFRFAEAESVRIEPSGDIAIAVGGATYHVERPTAYQDGASGRSRVRCRYVALRENEIGIKVGRYDRRTPLIIDPVLRYSTYLGGSGIHGDSDGANAIAVDGCGNAYVVGDTESDNFPTLDPLQAQSHKIIMGHVDGFIAKFDANGALVYSTYLGGSGSTSGGPYRDHATGVAVDVDGQVYVTGYAYSPDFPIQSAWQPTFGGECDAFVAKIDSTGQRLVYSTFLGGGGKDSGRDIAIDASGNAYVVGHTWGDFPTLDAFQPSMGGGPRDAFLTKLDAAGMAVYSTYLGGGGLDQAVSVAVDSGGSAVVAGVTYLSDFPLKDPFQGSNGGEIDVFVTKLDPAGTGLVFSTFLGGSDDDQSPGVAVDASGAIYVAGSTESSNFPTFAAFQGALRGAVDGFVTKLDAWGTPVYSTYLGGTGREILYGVAVDSTGHAFVAGDGTSTDYPIVSPVQPVGDGDADVVVSVLVPDGSSLLYSTIFGGSGGDGGGSGTAPGLHSIAVDGFGNAYIAGWTNSDDFPVKNPAQAALGGGFDAFVFVIDNGGGSFIPGPVGNTLKAVKDTPGAAIVFTWSDIAVATGYELYQHEVKSSTVWSSVAIALTGSLPGLSIPTPVEQLLFFKVAGTNCGVAGP